MRKGYVVSHLTKERGKLLPGKEAMQLTKTAQMHTRCDPYEERVA